MLTDIRTFDFKPLSIEIEVKDLMFVMEFPKLLGNPHKAAFYQLIWISKGVAIFHIDFRKIIIKENEILVIAAGQVCQFDTVSHYAGKMILFTDSFFTVTEIDSNFLHTAEILNPINLNQTVILDKQIIRKIISLMDNELNLPKDDYQAGIAQSYLRIILLETERKLKCSHPPILDNLGREFYNAVEKHFKVHRNNEFYINLLGVNEKSLSKEVKKLSGKTPKMYLDSRTILEAKRLLSYSNLSVKQIGFELGFDEATNFNKFFRKHTEITPIQFRNSSKK